MSKSLTSTCNPKQSKKKTDPVKEHTKSSDAKASKCHLKFFSRMIIFIKLAYLTSVISLKWQ